MFRTTLTDRIRIRPPIRTIHPVCPLAGPLALDQSAAMLTEIYIEALLVDEELADQVWQAWDAGVD